MFKYLIICNQILLSLLLLSYFMLELPNLFGECIILVLKFAYIIDLWSDRLSHHFDDLFILLFHLLWILCLRWLLLSWCQIARWCCSGWSQGTFLSSRLSQVIIYLVKKSFWFLWLFLRLDAASRSRDLIWHSRYSSIWLILFIYQCRFFINLTLQSFIFKSESELWFEVLFSVSLEKLDLRILLRHSFFQVCALLFKLCDFILYHLLIKKRVCTIRKTSDCKYFEWISLTISWSLCRKYRLFLMSSEMCSFYCRESNIESMSCCSL